MPCLKGNEGGAGTDASRSSRSENSDVYVSGRAGSRPSLRRARHGRLPKQPSGQRAHLGASPGAVRSSTEPSRPARPGRARRGRSAGAAARRWRRRRKGARQVSSMGRLRSLRAVGDARELGWTAGPAHVAASAPGTPPRRLELSIVEQERVPAQHDGSWRWTTAVRRIAGGRRSGLDRLVVAAVKPGHRALPERIFRRLGRTGREVQRFRPEARHSQRRERVGQPLARARGAGRRVARAGGGRRAGGPPGAPRGRSP